MGSVAVLALKHTRYGVVVHGERCAIWRLQVELPLTPEWFTLACEANPVAELERNADGHLIPRVF